MARISSEDATLAVLLGPMGSTARGPLRAEARRNFPEAIARNIRKEPRAPWSPQFVVERIHRDTSPKTLQVYSLLGIDDDELLALARKGLEKAGVDWIKVGVAPFARHEGPGPRLTIGDRVRAFGRRIKELFWNEG